MNVFTQEHTYKKFLAEAQSKRIAYVPTMGAVHQGHLELIRAAQKLGDIAVVSIFVNPTQFNEPSDFENYPRPLLQDIHKLEKNEVPVLFAPTVAEMYPDDRDMAIDLDLSHLTTPLEGTYRPGHFDGVITVVHRLLQIVQPQILVMGQKDFQQLAIIKAMIEHLNLDITLEGHPIIRESDGLALSSRNGGINSALRPLAPKIYEQLLHVKENSGRVPIDELVHNCQDTLTQSGFMVEYFSLVDASTLHEVHHWRDSDQIIVCVAAWLGDVRLIDNMPLF